MSKYNLPNPQLASLAQADLDAATVAGLWELFVQICIFWKNVPNPEPMYTRFESFLGNRIERDPNYVSEYRNAVEVIKELVKEKGPAEGYRFLLTNQQAGNAPAQTSLQRARQRVVNEFIQLQLSLGGFKDFTQAINYPGYIAGVNGTGPTPYRTPKTNV